MSSPPRTAVPSIYHCPSFTHAAWLPAPCERSRHCSSVCDRERERERERERARERAKPVCQRTCRRGHQRVVGVSASLAVAHRLHLLCGGHWQLTHPDRLTLSNRHDLDIVELVAHVTATSPPYSTLILTAFCVCDSWQGGRGWGGSPAARSLRPSGGVVPPRRRRRVRELEGLAGPPGAGAPGRRARLTHIVLAPMVRSCSAQYGPYYGSRCLPPVK
jgi:hypothetical protein